MNNDIIDQEKQLIIARLKSTKLPLGRLSVMTATGAQTFTVAELVESIEHNEEVGRQYVKEQMAFIRRVVNGDVYKLIADIESL